MPNEAPVIVRFRTDGSRQRSNLWNVIYVYEVIKSNDSRLLWAISIVRDPLASGESAARTVHALHTIARESM
jgi:hypothetical protein